MTPVNCCEAFNGTRAVTGVTATVFGGTLTLAEPATEGVLTELAATVTVKAAGGGLAGAVYVTVTPLAEVDGETVPQSVASHCTTHVTIPSARLCRVAGGMAPIAACCPLLEDDGHSADSA